MMLTKTYEPYDVVVVPFPFTDSVKTKNRPALVLSTNAFQKQTGHVTLAMITTAKSSQWPGDYKIKELTTTHLTTESYVRLKIFTLDLRVIKRKAGSLSKTDRTAFKKTLNKHLAI